MLADSGWSDLVPQRHLGPVAWAGSTVLPEQVQQVRLWIQNYHQVKENLEKISDINRELLRREKNQNKAMRRARK